MCLTMYNNNIMNSHKVINSNSAGDLSYFPIFHLIANLQTQIEKAYVAALNV